MNGKQILNLASATVLGGGLFVGSVGWADAQQHRHGADGATQEAPASMAAASQDEGMGDMMHDIMDEMMPGMMDEMMSHMMGGMMGGGMMGGMGDGAMTGWVGSMAGSMDDQHAQMQAAVAEALGLSVDELQAVFADGKTLPQIAEEQGIALGDLHEAVMDEFGERVR